MRTILRPLPLPDDVPGQLWLTAMPGRFESLTAFLDAAAQAGATGIVCLVAAEEIAARSPHYAEARRSGSLPLPVQDYPIPDYGLPEDKVTFSDLISGLCAELCRGRRLILHCAAGIGRTGLVAQQILMAWGEDPGLAREQVLRAGSRPETALQQQFCSRAVVFCPRT